MSFMKQPGSVLRMVHIAVCLYAIASMAIRAGAGRDAHVFILIVLRQNLRA